MGSCDSSAYARAARCSLERLHEQVCVCVAHFAQGISSAQHEEEKRQMESMLDLNGALLLCVVGRHEATWADGSSFFFFVDTIRLPKDCLHGTCRDSLSNQFGVPRLDRKRDLVRRIRWVSQMLRRCAATMWMNCEVAGEPPQPEPPRTNSVGGTSFPDVFVRNVVRKR